MIITWDHMVIWDHMMHKTYMLGWEVGLDDNTSAAVGNKLGVAVLAGCNKGSREFDSSSSLSDCVVVM